MDTMMLYGKYGNFVHGSSCFCKELVWKCVPFLGFS